ncbi:RnfABCDGE type electron transport complex subunit G [Crassaminicella profunda]|uniref:RnfABCDGE type electron transport complex subunit G n=1 Tax=Crassaminicella profunda TaxID=1286698 RepID=UPI001CA708B5|nr:RnfABCDGE type electron transport complex subunit G [Crassaminicella profunda]QZY56593.1 RnfABCDGE type electron transport complex subunit G [Crassaminicella profunda]
MKEIAKLGMILFIIAAVAATILGYTNDITKGPIEEQMIQANTKARQIVLSDATDFEEVEKSEYEGYENIVEVYKGLKDGEVVGYTIKTNPNGYGGAVEVMIGLGTDEVITGVNIGNHSETPGLGAKASGEFKDQYNGKSTNTDVNVIKSGTPKDNEVMAISGATITSKAVTKGVNSALKLFNEKLK